VQPDCFPHYSDKYVHPATNQPGTDLAQSGVHRIVQLLKSNFVKPLIARGVACRSCRWHGTCEQSSQRHLAMDHTLPDQALMAQLARYLRAYPLACDSLEGISQWWLDTAVAPTQLARVLQRMEMAGVVVRLSGADGQLRFRRTRLDAVIDAKLDHLLKE